MSAATLRRRTDAAARVRLLVLDVDGVLTDGRLYYGPRGEALKVFHVRDGLGVKLLAAAGVTVAVISGRRSSMTGKTVPGARRAIICYKVSRISSPPSTCCAATLGVSPGACACVGDDVPDVPLMREVGLSFAVADAHPQARSAAHVITRLPGGEGAVREVCDYLLEARRHAAASK